jgi:hypothetical protein
VPKVYVSLRWRAYSGAGCEKQAKRARICL